MQKKFISILLLLIFDSTKVQSLDLLEEMLNEMKQINQKVDLLNKKADNKGYGPRLQFSEKYQLLTKFQVWRCNGIISRCFALQKV